MGGKELQGELLLGLPVPQSAHAVRHPEEDPEVDFRVPSKQAGGSQLVEFRAFRV